MIFKYYDKPLRDLVENPNLWSLPELYNDDVASTRQRILAIIDDILEKVPEGVGDPDTIEKYGHLAGLIRNEDWSGIVAFNVSVPADNFPDDLKGLTAGINLSKFFAQYVAIETTPFSSTSAGKPGTSTFGLIDYEDNAIPDTYKTETYDFRVLYLTAIFRNAAMHRFGCEIAVKMDKLFGDVVRLEKSRTRYNEIFLKARYELHNGKPVYNFSASGSNRFVTTETSVLHDIEIIQATYATQSTVGNIITSAFSFRGRLNFKRLEKFDVLSFGIEDNEDPPSRQFLSFSNLQLVCTSPEGSKVKTIVFTPDLALDKQSSRARRNSLYARFPLRLTAFLPPQAVDNPGYLEVSTPLEGDKPSGEWYGLTCDLELGSVGALAGEAGLIVSILVAWQPKKESAYVGLRLPSAGLNEFNIQGILKIEFDRIVFDVYRDTEGNSRYTLMLKNIMLKFLHLKLPPNGRTEIIIFGDPEGTQDNKTLGWYAAYARGGS